MSQTKNQVGIRAFIALDLTTMAKDALEEIQNQVRSLTAADSVRWVKRPAFHLTLVFLGDAVRPDEIAQVCEALDQVGREAEPLALSLGELGCFPQPRNPRVIWVGVGGDSERLGALKGMLDQALEPLGWRPENRPFNPHLTLGRVKEPLGVASHNLPYGEVLREAAWPVNGIHLYHSQLTRQGSRYTKVHTARFGRPADA